MRREVGTYAMSAGIVSTSESSWLMIRYGVSGGKDERAWEEEEMMMRGRVGG